MTMDSLRILIVDDEPLVVRAIARMLTTEVVVGVTEPSAVGPAVFHGNFDGILLEVRMPAVDIDELLAGLGQRRPELLPRVVLMSGASQPASLERFPFVEKPMTTSAIRQLLARWRNERSH